jgi:serine/threonine protein kinase
LDILNLMVIKKTFINLIIIFINLIKGIIHGDLKPGNIVIKNDVLKMIDFANSIIITKEDLNNKSKCIKLGISKDYAAPEIF